MLVVVQDPAPDAGLVDVNTLPALSTATIAAALHRQPLGGIGRRCSSQRVREAKCVSDLLTGAHLEC